MSQCSAPINSETHYRADVDLVERFIRHAMLNTQNLRYLEKERLLLSHVAPAASPAHTSMLGV